MTREELINSLNQIYLTHENQSMTRDNNDIINYKLTMLFNKSFNVGLTCTRVKPVIGHDRVYLKRVDNGENLMNIEDIILYPPSAANNWFRVQS